MERTTLDIPVDIGIGSNLQYVSLFLALVYVVLTSLSLADAWLSRGLGHSIFIPPSLSPIVRVVIPLVKHFAVSS